MARTTRPLTNTEIKQTKIKDKEYNLADGDGLALRIKPNGTKRWLFNYSRPYTKRRANLSIGSYPELSLAEARVIRLKYRNLLIQDIDPQEYRDNIQSTEKEAHSNTFLNVSLKWHKIKKTAVSSEHASDIWKSLELHIFPKMAEIPIHKIRAKDTIEVLDPIAKRGTLEIVRRLCQRLNEIMVFATNIGLVDANPLSGIIKAFGVPQAKNMLTIKPEELPELMKALNRASITFSTRCLIEWQLHTMVRPGEAAGTRWDEIDLETKLWTIPAERMKKKRDHIVPLTEQTLSLLEELKPVSGHRDFVFPGHYDPKVHASPSAANMALKRMGYNGKLVAHGLRSIASTVLNDHEFNPDIIEASLAHVGKNEVRRAYNRAEYIERRTKLMCWWSDYIERAATGNMALAGSKKNLRIVNN